MTQSELKELTNLGAELGAAKAEIEVLREQVKVLQSDANSWQSGYDKGRHDGARHRKSEVEQLRQHKNEYMDAAEVTRKALLAEIESLRNGLKNARYRIEQGRVWNGMGWTLTGLHAHQQQKALDEIDAALSQQPEPTDTFTAVDMATAAAQGFRDGQAAVEQAAVQDELLPCPFCGGEPNLTHGDYVRDDLSPMPVVECKSCSAWVRVEDWNRRATRPAQTEQQPVAIANRGEHAFWVRWTDEGKSLRGPGIKLYSAPIAQTAPQGKFRMGDRVKKTSGSEWVGHVCGTYSTALTPEGYAVESEAHAGSVQIYPAKALELVPMAAKEA